MVRLSLSTQSLGLYFVTSFQSRVGWEMNRTELILVPGGVEEDEHCRHDLDSAEHHEDTGVDGDRLRSDQERRHEPNAKCQSADAR